MKWTNLNPMIPLEKLFKMNRVEIIKTAVDLNTPVTTLEELAENEDWIIRQCVVENPSTPKYVLGRLSESESTRTRIDVAKSKNTIVEVLKKLAFDKEWMVREMVVRNPNANNEIKEIVENTNNLHEYLK